LCRVRCRCWVDGAVFADDGGGSDGGPAVDDGAAADGDVVCYGCGLFNGSVVVGVEVVEGELVCFEEVFYL